MNNFLPNVSLDAAGFVAIAEITTIARRTALTGTSIYPDMFVLCPGLHRQQSAPELNGGEYPAAAAMTTGYVFRVENPATALFLRSKGKTGHLVTVEVSSSSKDTDREKKRSRRLGQRFLRRLLASCIPNSDWTSFLFYCGAVCASPAVLVSFICIQEWWGVFCLLVLMTARLCNVFVIRQRCSDMGWKGSSEPGQQGDLLILLSGDCWIRMQGAVDDLKAVTSGQWWRDRTIMEEFISALATVLVYINTALVSNVNTFGQLILLILFVLSAGLLFLSNATTTAMHMYGRKIKVKGQPKKYHRRRDMAEELIKETGRRDWAQRLGLIVGPNDFTDADLKQTPVIM
jgi:hypothetical protein